MAGYDDWDMNEFRRETARLIRDIVERDAKNKINTELELKIKEHFLSCWRDDDCPQAEKTFGVKKAA